MGRKSNAQKEAELAEAQEVDKVKIEEPKAEAKEVDKATVLLKDIDRLEKEIELKKKEYSDYIASQRKESKQPSVHECLQLAMRDDLNSDRRELKKITGMALSKLKRNR